jgi:hypothetical protein
MTIPQVAPIHNHPDFRIYLLSFSRKIWNLRELFVSLQREIKTDYIMLGIESPRKPITGQFAKELREALVRARTGNLNQSEKESVLRSEKVSRKYNAVWK